MHPYLKYYFSASTKYQVHSPFVFEFLTDIFEDDRFYHFMGFIENYRRHQYKPNTLVEIGDSLGIASLYQATPNPQVPLVSIMSNTTLADKTTQYFKRLGTRNIQLLAGDIAKNIPIALRQLNTIEQLFFNGFWGKATTLSYFETCLAKMPLNAVFIFRTPYASEATQAFWETIKKHKKVRLSIDIYDLGFLFFRSEHKEVAHYKIIESWKKPWAIY